MFHFKLYIILNRRRRRRRRTIIQTIKNQGEKKFDYVEVLVEIKISKIRPDVILINSDDENLIIEIAVTSFIDDIKMQKIEELKIPTIEIDLKDFYKEEKKEEGSIDEEILQIMLIDEVATKNWIGKSKNYLW